MQVIIGIVGVFSAVAIIIFTREMDMAGGVKVLILTIAVLTAVYCLARIQPKESKKEQDPGK